MAGLDINLQASRDAVIYVRSTLPLGAQNKVEDTYFRNGKTEACFHTMRGAYPDWVLYGPRSDAWINYVAAAARKSGCGNCAEQCALAIQYLLDLTPITSLDFMAFDPQRFDHMFLVIGRPSDTDIHQIWTWGADAVICDPWYPQMFSPGIDRRSYPATDAYRMMTMYLPAGESTIQMLGHWGA